MKIKNIIVGVSLCLGLISFSTVGYCAKARISIPNFENKAGVDRRVANSFVDMLATAFSKSRKFNVLERSSLKKVANEQAFGASGAVDQSTSAQMGKIKGSSFVLIGTITQMGTSNSRTGAFGVNVSSSKAKIGIDIRLVDSTTGEVKFADSFSKEKSSSGVSGMGMSSSSSSLQGALGDLAREVSDQIVVQTMFAIFPAKIIKIKGSKVTLNYGDSILHPSELYDVYDLGEEMIDPDTGESLGSDEEYAGKVKIMRATTKLSFAKIIDGELAVGMILRPKKKKEKRASKVSVPW